MDCPKCGAQDVIEIKNKVEDIEVYFFSCYRCEQKWWDREGNPVTLREVLELARRQDG